MRSMFRLCPSQTAPGCPDTVGLEAGEVASVAVLDETAIVFLARSQSRLDEVVDAVRRVREQGYAVSDGEYELGLRSVAVPVPNPVGRVEVAMTVSVHAPQVPVEATVAQLLPALLRGAQALATML